MVYRDFDSIFYGHEIIERMMAIKRIWGYLLPMFNPNHIKFVVYPIKSHELSPMMYPLVAVMPDGPSDVSRADSRYPAPNSMGCAELLLPLLVAVRCGQLGWSTEP